MLQVQKFTLSCILDRLSDQIKVAFVFKSSLSLREVQHIHVFLIYIYIYIYISGVVDIKLRNVIIGNPEPQVFKSTDQLCSV